MRRQELSIQAYSHIQIFNPIKKLVRSQYPYLTLSASAEA